MQDRIDQSTACCASRSPASAWCGRSCASPRRPSASRRPTTTSPTTSLRAGRLMSSMFPTVNLLINVSSVAVLWIGANRVSIGEIQVGTLVAYLTYLVQILMSVVMATFMVSMIPRASVSADRIQEVLDTPSSVVPPADPVTERARARHARVPRRRLPLPRRRARRCCSDISFRDEAGQTTAIVGSTGAGKTTLVNLDPAPVRRTAGTVLVGGVDVRDLDPEVLWSTHRARAAAAVPVLGHGREQPAVRQARRHRRRDVGGARGRAGRATSSRPCPAGSTPASSRAAPTCRAASASGCRSPGRSSASPRSTCSTTRSRRSTSPPTPGCAPRSGRTRADAAVVIVAQRVSTISTADEILVLEDGAIVGRGTHDELLETCPTYAEIVAVPDRREERGMTGTRRHTHDDGSGTDAARTSEPHGERRRRRSPPQPGRRAGRARRSASACRPRSRRTSARRCAGSAACSARAAVLVLGARRSRSPASR